MRRSPTASSAAVWISRPCAFRVDGFGGGAKRVVESRGLDRSDEGTLLEHQATAADGMDRRRSDRLFGFDRAELHDTASTKV